MADNLSLITCPADCATDNVWPAIPTEQDCPSYPQTLSQVSDLIIIPDGADDVFTDFNDDYPAPTYANDTIDNTTSDNSTAHILTGIGGVAEPEELTLDYPKLQQQVIERTYTLTHRIFNLSNAQYDYLLKIQCGALNFTFYYCDLGGFTYGIEGGLVPYSVDVDMPRGGGNDDRAFADIIITWKAKGDPDRITTPANLGVNV